MVLALVFFLSIAGAAFAQNDEQILARMELDIKLAEISKRAYSAAVKRVEALVQRTSIAKQFNEIQGHLVEFFEKNQCTTRRERMDELRRLAPRVAAGLTDPLDDNKWPRITSQGQVRNTCSDLTRAQTKVARVLAEKAGKLFSQMAVLEARFIETVYYDEIAKRLAGLKVNLDNKLRKRLKKLYKSHSA